MSIARPLAAYAFIWLLFLAVPAAREVVLAQFRRLRAPGTAGSCANAWLCGAVLVTVDAVLLIRLGKYTLSSGWQPGAIGMATALFYAAAVATTEEMILRGLLLTRIRQFTGDAAAIVVTAAIFAVMHVGRSDYALITAAQYALDGLLFGWLAVVTGSMWAPAAMHLAKNFGVIVLFGTDRHLVAPLLAETGAPLPEPWNAAADFAAYAIVLGFVVFLFPRRSGDRVG